MLLVGAAFADDELLRGAMEGSTGLREKRLRRF
jgi:hypothetical protein